MRWLVGVGMALLLFWGVTRRPPPPSSLPDLALRMRLGQREITVPDQGRTAPPAQVELGRLLFFDNILSGNRDLSCATCHTPLFATSDGRLLSLGSGGRGLGPDRIRGEGRPDIPRHAPELFNRGAPAWRTMFWDMRITQESETSFQTPAGGALPNGLRNVLAAQALFPLTSRDEMRGQLGDYDIFGRPNELAPLADDDFQAIWRGLIARLQATPAYRPFFEQAYPETPFEEIRIVHIVNAIAAFEQAAFTLLNSPWDRYLRGENNALSPAAKRGALLFYGRLGCAVCHSGSLMSDQQAHNLAIPQIGPGKGNSAPYDVGHELVSGNPRDRYAFRTPPLRNVAVTAPYMHNGAFRTLDAVIRHHLDPIRSLRRYNPREHLPAGAIVAYQNAPRLQADLIATLDPNLRPLAINEREMADLLAFLHALTDPAVEQLDREIPSWVPSGLPVAGRETQRP